MGLPDPSPPSSPVELNTDEEDLGCKEPVAVVEDDEEMDDPEDDNDNEEDTDDNDEAMASNSNDGDNDDNDDDDEEMSQASYSAIRFTEYVELYEIDCDYTPEEEAILWFRSEEYSSFLDQCEAKAKEITEKYQQKQKASGEGNDDDGDNVTSSWDPMEYVKLRDFIGLEAWTKEGYKLRQKLRLNAIDKVLDEQFAQWDDGKEDPEKISEVYVSAAEESKSIAAAKALHLERDVKGYLESTLEKYDSVKELSTQSLASASTHSGRSSLWNNKKSASIGSLSVDEDEEFNEEKTENDEQIVDMEVVEVRAPPRPCMSKQSGSIKLRSGLNTENKDEGWNKISPQPRPSMSKQSGSIKLSGDSNNEGKDEGWSKISPQPRPSMSKQTGSIKLGSSKTFTGPPSTRSLEISPSRRSLEMSPPSPPTSSRSLPERRMPPKSKSVTGRRKPEALAAAWRTKHEPRKKVVKKHAPSTGSNLKTKPAAPKTKLAAGGKSTSSNSVTKKVKKVPKLNTVTVNKSATSSKPTPTMVKVKKSGSSSSTTTPKKVVKKPGAPSSTATPKNLKVKKTGESSSSSTSTNGAPKTLKFKKSGIIPSSCTPLSASTAKKVQKDKKKSVNASTSSAKKEGGGLMPKLRLRG